MHHSFFTTALLIASNALAQDPSLTPQNNLPANTPTNTPTGSPPITPQTTNTVAPPPAPGFPPKLTKPTRCKNSFMPFSQFELAQMAQMDSPQNATGLPDPKTLSKERTATFCKNDDLTAICELSSCNSIPATGKDCRVYDLNEDGNGGTLGANVTTEVDCTGDYNFNQTNVPTPYICTVADKDETIYSCGDRNGQHYRTCDDCFDIKSIESATT